MCPSPNDLVEYVRKKRNVSKENCHVRIGLDSGGDFMKITMNVIDKSKHTADNKSFCGDSDTSVDKLFMIGFVKKMEAGQRESYQLGGVATSLDWVEVADLFWNINHTYNLKYDILDGQGSEMIGS